jgi:MFS family permease
MASKATADLPLRGAYWSLAALCAMNLLNYIDRYILAAVVKPIQDDLVIHEDALAGLLATAFIVSYSLFSPFMGWLGDRVTRKYLLAAGVGLWSLATYGSGLAGRLGLSEIVIPLYGPVPGPFVELLLARSIMGIGEATYAILAPSLIADLFPKSRRNAAMAAFYVAIPIGAAMGYGLGGLMRWLYGWQMAFFVVGVPGFAVALAALWLREPQRGASEPEEEKAAARQEPLPLLQVYAALARNRSYIFNVLGMALFTFALGGLQYWAPKFFESVRGMDQFVANLGLGGVVAISGIVGTFLGGWLGDRLGPWLGSTIPPRRGGGYFWLSGLTMLAAMPFFALALLATHPVLIFSAMLVGLTFSFVNAGPSNTILVNVTAPRIRATAVAVNIFFIHFLGDIPSPPMMGKVTDLSGSLFWGLAITVPCVALSGLFFCLGAPHLREDEEAVVRGKNL